MIRSVEREKEVILVDDDKLEEIILRKYLEKSEVAIALRVFDSGLKFIAHMECIKSRQEPMPDMVLLDLRMWGMDGFEILEIIRQDPAFRSVPVIVAFTNSHDPSDRKKSLQLGANDYFHKPRNGDEYIRFLHSLEATI